MEELDNSKNFAKTNCGHSFCLTCLVRSLKNNNTCPLCRTNIEEEKPVNPPNRVLLNDCVELIKDELDMFPYRDHVDAITMFDNPISSLKNTLRVFSLGLSKSIIDFQNQEDDDYFVDEPEEEDEGEDEEAAEQDEEVDESDRIDSSGCEYERPL